MREIKFRAWDTEAKKWFYCLTGLTFESSPTGVYAIEVMSTDGDTAVFEHPRFKLIQYVGVKDRHLKEIYEGDIVRVPENWSGDHFYKECMAYVKYDEDCFHLVNPNDEYDIVHQDWWWKDLEVVGNIFENPNIIAEYYDSKRLAEITYQI